MSEDATALSDPRRILCAHADWNGAGAYWKQDGEPCRVQRACDRCTQGVMDVDNPHLSGACGCPCHGAHGPESPPITRPARTVEVSDRTGQHDPDLP